MSNLMMYCIVFGSLSAFLVSATLTQVSVGLYCAEIGPQENPFEAISNNFIAFLILLIFLILFHIIVYQISLRKCGKRLKKPMSFVGFGTLICFVAVTVLPALGIFFRFIDGEFWGWRESIIVFSLVVLFLNYLDGIIYALVHYGKNKVIF